MPKLTPAKAAHHLAYIERERSLGRATARLEEIAEQRLAFLRRKRACIVCGRPLTDPTSIDRGVGPECHVRRKEAS
jgi:hypothetical protein